MIAGFVVSAVQAFMLHGTANYLVLLVGEMLTLVLVISARGAREVRLSVVSMAAAFMGSFYYLFFSFSVHSESLVPLQVAETLQVAGVLFQIFAKLSLGRSFGLVPANRAVVTGGAYQLVRHPIYLGYFVAHMGFLLGAFSLHNLIVLVFLYGVQFVRIVEEEKVLKLDPLYQDYMTRTRWRFLPGIF
nr:isoprenylcysteine carboxylmethyltransferase family protein [Pseudomonas nitroreducens]